MLPMYQNVGKVAFKKDLTNTKELLKFLDNPENKGKHIHVTGSNGKGSVSSILASVLSESGYKVGLYNLTAFLQRVFLIFQYFLFRTSST